ncbi:cytochrome P450 [Streptomyces antioxidans]|uniref:Cytochrome P450 n=1 Tax=Streptomyces antioxidans TaxID=1507734 RepID=A0A1V4CUB9_9ACTN|nr:cytochrome P450 [Streptomyces antioxidans]OPF70368.1 cytochrome P450 [Streptomyces antioxidans]
MSAAESTDESIPRLPFDQSGLMELPPRFAELRENDPIVKILTPVGDPAWLVTRHEDVKKLISDARLGRSHFDPPNAPRYSAAVILGGPRGEYETEVVDHTKARQVLIPSFSAQRMRSLRPRIQRTVDDLLSRFQELPQPADFHQEIAKRLPVFVISELLGIPFADREQLGTWSQGTFHTSDQQVAVTAMLEMREYIAKFIELKRAEPADDVITDLVLKQQETGFPPDDAIQTYVSTLIIAGFETSVSFTDYGTLLFLRNPDQRALLEADPGLAPRAVEEILRFAPASDACITRYAREDFEYKGTRISEGDLIALSPQTANRDPRVFREPERFDITRNENPHMTLAYGLHYCIGAPLVRVMLDVLYQTLFARLPELRLAVPLDELVSRNNVLTGGLTSLPVAW